MPAATPPSLSSWLSLLSPVHQCKPRFMALASAVLSQAADLLALYDSALLEAFALDTASGAQLDALGQLAGVTRPSASTSDEAFRQYLRAHIQINHWDGSNETLAALLSEAFPDAAATLSDNLDGTVTATLPGSSSFPLKDIFPRPAGIRLIEGS